MEVIKRMLVQCMQDQANPQVRSQKLIVALCFLDFMFVSFIYINFCQILLQIRTLAARAAASFVLSNESNTALLKHFADLLPGILQVK